MPGIRRRPVIAAALLVLSGGGNASQIESVLEGHRGLGKVDLEGLKIKRKQKQKQQFQNNSGPTLAIFVRSGAHVPALARSNDSLHDHAIESQN